MWIRLEHVFLTSHLAIGNSHLHVSENLRLVSKMASIPWKHGGWRFGWTKAWVDRVFPTELMIRFQACKQDVKLSPAPKKQITSTSSSTSGNVDILQSTQLPARITKPLSIKDRSIPKRDTFDLFDITVDRIQFVGEFLLWYNSATEIDEQIFKWKKIPWNLTNKTKMVKKRET